MRETVYYGGTILTMEDDVYAEAILAEDGVIKMVGTKESVFAAKSEHAELIDLHGSTLMPSFIDAHSHITAYANTLGQLSLNGAGSFDEIKERLRTYKQKNNINSGEWIIGFGYDHNQLAEKCHPDKSILDAACPENPVLVAHASGHMGVMNSAALVSAGIGKNTEPPEGGVIGCDKDGQPSGYLEETAFTVLAASKAPRPTREQMESWLIKAQDAYLEYGVTTVQDGLTRDAEWGLLSAMAETGKLKIDVVSYIDQQKCGSILKDYFDWHKNYRHHLRIGGWKIFLDGSPQGRTAWMTEPYFDAPDGYRGYPIHTDEAVEGFVRQAMENEVQQLVHCNGDAAAEQMITAYEKVYGTDKSETRPVMIHAQLVRPDQLARMSKLGMIASFFIAHTYFWGDTHCVNFGNERAAQISPARSAIREGVVYTFHQDTPVLPPDMLMTVWCAVNRVSRSGVRLGEKECVTPLEALRAVTVNAAYQYFEQDKKGSIKAGKDADFVILDRSPLAVPPMDIRHIKVLQTIKAGETLYRRKE